MNDMTSNPTESEGARKPYNLAALNPDELEALLHRRPDLRKEIFAEANRREFRLDQIRLEIALASDAMTNEGG